MEKSLGWCINLEQNDTLAGGISALGGEPGTLLVSGGVTLGARTIIVPPSVTLKVVQGGMITVGATETLTINGPLCAGAYQCFDAAAGAVVRIGPATPELHVAWWGAKGNADDPNPHDDTPAIAATTEACSSRSVVRFWPSTHKTTVAITPPVTAAVRWVGTPGLTKIQGFTDDSILDLCTNALQHISIDGVAFSSYVSATKHTVKTYAYAQFENCAFASPNNSAAAALYCIGWINTFRECVFGGGGMGLQLDADANGNVVDQCVFSATPYGGLVCTGGRLNVLRVCAFEGCTGGAVIIKKHNALELSHCNFENNPFDVSFRANSPQHADGDLSGPGQSFVPADIDRIRIVGCTFLSINVAGHICFDGGKPHGLLVDGNWFTFGNRAFVVTGAHEPGDGFVVRGNTFHDNLGAGVYNIFNQTVLYNSVRHSWSVESEQYEPGATGYGTTYFGEKRLNIASNLLRHPPPIGWAKTVTGGSTFEVSSDLNWMGDNVLRITRPTPDAVARGSITLELPTIDSFAEFKWWTLSLWVRRATAHGRLLVSLYDGDTTSAIHSNLQYANRWYQIGFSKFHWPAHLLSWTITLEDDDPAAGSNVVYVAGIRLAPGIDERTGIVQPPMRPVGNAGGDLGSSYPDPMVVKIQGRPVSSTAPTNGQVLMWNATSGQWEPTTLP